MVVLDVLRKAATLRESNEGAGDIKVILDNIAPLLEHGTAVLAGHHFAKANVDTKNREAGDRMTGTGALYSNAAFLLSIVKCDRAKRTYELEFVTRDGGQIADMDAALVGQGTARYGGFRYGDTARLTVDIEGEAEQEKTDERRAEILKIVTHNPGEYATKVVALAGGKKEITELELEAMVSDGLLETRPGRRKDSRCFWVAGHAPEKLEIEVPPETGDLGGTRVETSSFPTRSLSVREQGAWGDVSPTSGELAFERALELAETLGHRQVRVGARPVGGDRDSWVTWRVRSERGDAGVPTATEVLAALDAEIAAEGSAPADPDNAKAPE